MKKTFLSLAFVLSISLAFGAETKPVATENKTVSLNEKSKEISLRESIIQPKKDITIAKTVDMECFVLSCKTQCYSLDKDEKPFEGDDAVRMWELCEEVYCGGLFDWLFK
jgi:hypothetical protein